jgi:hypothetical protein
LKYLGKMVFENSSICTTTKINSTRLGLRSLSHSVTQSFSHSVSHSVTNLYCTTLHSLSHSLILLTTLTTLTTHHWPQYTYHIALLHSLTRIHTYKQTYIQKTYAHISITPPLTEPLSPSLTHSLTRSLTFFTWMVSPLTPQEQISSFSGSEKMSKVFDRNPDTVMMDLHWITHSLTHSISYSIE